MKKITLVLIILLVGCTTTRNISPSPTFIPTSLTIKDIESAILLSLEDVTIQKRELEVRERRIEKRTVEVGGDVLVGAKSNRRLETTDTRVGVTDKNSEIAGASGKLSETGKAEVTIERRSRRGRVKRQHWFYEGRREKDIIYAGFHNRRFYMRVEIKYNENDLTLSIVESRNLKQGRWYIHKRAFIWLNSLERDIRANLGKYDRVKYEQEMLNKQIKPTQ